MLYFNGIPKQMVLYTYIHAGFFSSGCGGGITMYRCIFYWPFLTMTWLTVTEYLCHIYGHSYLPVVVITIRSFPHSWLVNAFVTRVTRRVRYVDQDTVYPSGVPELTPVFSGDLQFSAYCFVDSCLSCCPFSFNHSIVCPSIYVWLPLWYLQTFVY